MIFELIDRATRLLLPDVEMDPERRETAIRTWRLTIGLMVVMFSTHMAWACGWIPGIQGFAMAADVEKKIDQAVEPIKKKLEEIDDKLNQSDAVQKKILVAQLASQLRDLHSLRCSTTNEIYRRRLNSDIEEAQQEFRNLTGERYPLGGCQE